MKLTDNFAEANECMMEKRITLKSRIEAIKDASQNIFAAAYQMRKDLFGDDQLEKSELLPAKCMLDDLEQIYTFLCEAYNIIQETRERIV